MSETFWQEVKDFFSAAEVDVEAFLKPFISQFMTVEGPIILKAAAEAVAVFAAQSMPGAQKQTGAYQTITTNLEAQSITIGASIINSAIEAGVAAIKAPAVPVTPNMP